MEKSNITILIDRPSDGGNKDLCLSCDNSLIRFVEGVGEERFCSSEHLNTVGRRIKGPVRKCSDYIDRRFQRDCYQEKKRLLNALPYVMVRVKLAYLSDRHPEAEVGDFVWVEQYRAGDNTYYS